MCAAERGEDLEQGHCQVDEVSAWLPSRLNAALVQPPHVIASHCFPSQQTVVTRPLQMSTHSEEIPYEAVHGGEALHLGGRFEARKAGLRGFDVTDLRSVYSPVQVRLGSGGSTVRAVSSTRRC